MNLSKLIENLEQDKFFRFIKKYWRFLLFVFIGAYIYSAIHELLHYYFITYFGYSAKFCWICIPTNVKILTPLTEVMKTHYFIFAMAPYILSTILLLIFFILFLILKNKYIFYLSIIPALDTFVNAFIGIPIAYLTNKGNDFLNLFRISFSSEVYFFILIPIILFLLIYLNYKRYSQIFINPPTNNSTSRGIR